MASGRPPRPAPSPSSLAACLELVDHLVEVLAGVVAQLLAHLAHPARDALRVVLVEAASGVVGERRRSGASSERTIAKRDIRRDEIAAPAVLADGSTRPRTRAG